MPSDRETRKRAELLAKLGSVVDELQDWQATVGVDKVLQRHWSQVEKVVGDLRPLVDRVGSDIRSADVGRDWLGLEARVLDLHRVWGFFRDKLMLRRLEFAPYLLMADEFAYACYEPARLAAVRMGSSAAAGRREPPLVYLSAVASPFSIARGSSAMAELGPDELTSRAARAVVAGLPVPVIGVPWFQLRHLPDAVIIGHEVGHLVLSDFVGLTAVRELLAAALARAGQSDDKVQACWWAWAEEAFADAYGTLCGGAGYAGALADFLLVKGTEREPTDPGYPPPATRVLLAEAVLEVAGCAAAADRLRSRRTEEGDPPAEPAEAGRQARVVAKALVNGPYAAFGGALTSVISCAEQCQTGSQPNDLLHGWAPTTEDIRTLLAVTVETFEADPAGFAAAKVADRILRCAEQIQKPGKRYLEDAPAAAPATRSGADQPADRERTDALYQLLTEEPSSTPTGEP